MIEFLSLFLTFFKIGIVSFGGGYAMIPLLTDEVLAHGWMAESELLNFIAISESTPGPIAINMATFIGSTQGFAVFGNFFGRFLGAFMATLGVVLPSFIIILVIAALIKNLLDLAGVKAFLTGVRPVVIGLIVSTGILLALKILINLKTLESSIVFDYKAVIIFAVNVIVYVIYKLIKKRNISPILLIIISAILGVCLYSF